MTPAPGARPPIPPLVRGLALVMTLVISGLGLYAMLGEHYYGYSSRHNVELTLDGRPAIVMGAGLAIFGLFPLAFRASSARGAGWWASATLSIGIALMLGSAFVA